VHFESRRSRVVNDWKGGFGRCAHAASLPRCLSMPGISLGSRPRDGDRAAQVSAQRSRRPELTLRVQGLEKVSWTDARRST
jgi:hypothetical protein